MSSPTEPPRIDLRTWGVFSLCLVVTVGFALIWEVDRELDLADAVPERITDGEYATSDTCQSCHPDQYDSWHRSYHRTMTQVATPSSVLGSFDDVVLEDRGFTYRLGRRGDQFWVDIPDPLWFEARYELLRNGRVPTHDLPESPPRIHARVVMTTGSHHLQNYWMRRPESGELYGEPDDGSLVQLPWVWMIAEGRWIPNQDSFLSPPTEFVGGPSRWNAECSQCHSVATEPAASESYTRFETRSVELGIACEACHGPASEHVRTYGSPARRYIAYFRRLRGSEAPDPTITNPARLDKERAVEACGYCHSYGEWRDGAAMMKDGVPFRPGDRLDPLRSVFRYSDDSGDQVLREVLERDSLALAGAFWRDGTIRVVGREYNGLLESACFWAGDLTCQSCHSMHEYEEPSDQLDSGMDENGACAQCHGALAENLPEHTRHAPESSGSECMNCHMPRTTYGLFSAVRSHRIDNPSVQTSVESGRPNACNLCHLDKTLAWTGERLQEWYGQPLVELNEDQQSVSAAVLWVLKGDAVQRALLAWHMGWDQAQQASGDSWLAPYLSQLLVDSYAAPRQVAYRSLVTLPGLRSFRYDFVASRPEHEAKSIEALQLWLQAGGATVTGPSILIGADGAVNTVVWARLLAGRDRTRLAIIE